MRSRLPPVFLMVLLLLGTPLSGCFGDRDSSPSGSSDLTIEGSYIAGDWSKVTLVAKNDLSVYIPYFVVDPGSFRAQNGTVLDLKSGTSKTVDWLLPPRNPSAMVMVGDYGRTEWPVRAANESWQDWIEGPSNGGAVKVTENGDNGSWNW